MALPARAEGSRSRDSTCRSDARSWSAGKRRTEGSATGSTEEERMLARDALMNNPQRLLETGKPCASKGACTVGAGASEKGWQQYLVGVLCYKNLGDAVECYLKRQPLSILAPSPMPTSETKDKSTYEQRRQKRLSQATFEKKQEIVEKVREMHQQGRSGHDIAADLGLARGTERRVSSNRGSSPYCPTQKKTKPT